MADEEEDDPVVQEVDVYLAKSLAKNLYLFQYPVRPAEVTYNNVPHLKAKIKPQQQKVELELGLNTRSKNYYQPRGEQIALDVNGTNQQDGEQYYESGVMDKQVLVSSRASVGSANYAVAILREGELHITPLQGVLQLRPNFDYMNKGEANIAQASANQDEDSQDEEEEAKTLTVRFARRESEKAKAQRLSSFKYLEKKEAEEDWINLDYHSIQDELAESERLKLYCNECDNEAPEISLSPKAYLKHLMPSSTKQESIQPKMPRNVLSLTQLREMDLPDQVKALLKNAKTISFSQLCALLSPVSREAAILKCVQQFGVLVQGCWVVKSEILYPEGSVSPNSGIPAEILCRGRDYIMWRFTHSRVVVRKDIATVTKLPNDDIKEVLEQMAKMRLHQGWEFILPFDADFTHKHPDIVKQQNTFWENKHQLLSTQLNLSKIHEKGVPESKKTDAPHTGDKKSTKPSKTTLTKTDKTSINNNDKEEPVPRSPSPMEVDCKEVTKIEDSNTSISREPMDLDNEHFEEVCTRLAEFVCAKLGRTVLSFKEFKRLLLLMQTACEPGDVMHSGISDALLEDVIMSTGAKEIKIKWPTVELHNDIQSRRFFAFKSVGDQQIDKMREVLFDMFESSHCIKKNDFNNKASEMIGIEPTKKEWATLQQDLLEKGKHPTYYLKGMSTVLNGT